MLTIRSICICFALSLSSCSDAPRPGSAYSQAAEAQGRAEATRESADKAAQSAAVSEGLAIALEAQARSSPTADLIRRASVARAEAIVSQRVSDAMERLATDASATASATGAERAYVAGQGAGNCNVVSGVGAGFADCSVISVAVFR